jgi:hypothetical protein
VSGIRMMGARLGRAWGSAWTAAPGCSRRCTDPAEVVPLPPVRWLGAVAHAAPSRAAVATRIEAFRIICP